MYMWLWSELASLDRMFHFGALTSNEVNGGFNLRPRILRIGSSSKSHSKTAMSIRQ